MAKEKQKIVLSDFECIEQNNRSTESDATFLTKAAKQPEIKPGEQPRIIATKYCSFKFDNATAKFFEPGKKYKITIEEQ